jgi:hypothetical protein
MTYLSQCCPLENETTCKRASSPSTWLMQELKESKDSNGLCVARPSGVTVEQRESIEELEVSSHYSSLSPCPKHT